MRTTATNCSCLETLTHCNNFQQTLSENPSAGGHCSRTKNCTIWLNITPTLHQRCTQILNTRHKRRATLAAALRAAADLGRPGCGVFARNVNVSFDRIVQLLVTFNRKNHWSLPPSCQILSPRVSIFTRRRSCMYFTSLHKTLWYVSERAKPHTLPRDAPIRQS